MADREGLGLEWEGPRVAEEHELAEAVELADLVLWQNNLGHGHAWAHVYRTGNLSNICVAKHKGRVVHASAMYFHTVTTPAGHVCVAGLSGVCTHPDFRRYGIGSRAMRFCLDHMAAGGAQLGLLSTPIPDWYRKFGWELAGSEDSYYLDRGNVTLLPQLPGLAVREAAPADQPAVLALLNRAPGGGRPAAIDRILLDVRQPLTLLGEQAGQLLGAVRTESRRVIEYAGETEVVAALLRATCERLDDAARATTDRDAHFKPVLDASLRVVSPGWPAPLKRYLDDLRIPYQRSYLGMLRVLDPAGLLAGLGLPVVVTGADGAAVTLGQQGETASFDVRRLAKLLFGPERVSPFCAGLLPAAFHVWPWDRV